MQGNLLNHQLSEHGPWQILSPAGSDGSLGTHAVLVWLVQIGAASAPHLRSTRKESRAELCQSGVDRSRVPCFIFTQQSRGRLCSSSVECPDIDSGIYGSYALSPCQRTAWRPLAIEHTNNPQSGSVNALGQSAQVQILSRASPRRSQLTCA